MSHEAYNTHLTKLDYGNKDVSTDCTWFWLSKSLKISAQNKSFVDLRSLCNAVIRFHNVRVPKENIVSGEGKGLKVALTALNAGRITLPAAGSGLARVGLDASL